MIQEAEPRRRRGPARRPARRSVEDLAISLERDILDIVNLPNSDFSRLLATIFQNRDFERHLKLWVPFAQGLNQARYLHAMGMDIITPEDVRLESQKQWERSSLDAPRTGASTSKS